jgi:hypothetical protein
MNEVADQLKNDVQDHLSLEAARKAAEKYLEELKQGIDWREIAERENMAIKETGFFSRGSNIPNIGYVPSISESAFSLSDKMRYPDQPFAAHNKVYVIRWLGKEGIKKDLFNKEKDDFGQMLSLSKERLVWDRWLNTLRSKASIKIVTPLNEL